MDAGRVATTSYAAGLACGYIKNGFTDWFLPSQDELNAMCNYSRNPTDPSAPTVECLTTSSPTTQEDVFAAGAFGFAAEHYRSSSQFDAY